MSFSPIPPERIKDQCVYLFYVHGLVYKVHKIDNIVGLLKCRFHILTIYFFYVTGGDVPNILQEVQVPIVQNSECQMMFHQAGHQKAIQNNFVCAGYTNGGQDSCEVI